MYMLDSCVCIDFMQGHLPIGYDVLRRSDPRLFKIPAIVEAELRLGAEKSRNPSGNRMILETFLTPFEIAAFDSKCAATYARLRNKLESAGTPIGPNDMLIAATALANEAVLVTNNIRKFKRVPGLSLESWSECSL